MENLASTPNLFLQFLNTFHLPQAKLYLALVVLGSIAFFWILFILIRKNKQKAKPIERQALFEKPLPFAQSIKSVFSNTDTDLNELKTQLEETLLLADAGLNVTQKIMEAVFNNTALKTKDDLLNFVKSQMQMYLTDPEPFSLKINQAPYVIYFVGVNGVGKTTTIGKLAKRFKNEGHKVMLVAADTFRAAASEQLRQWSLKQNLDFFGGKDEADPSSVIVDGLKAALKNNADVVLVDTAGRLHTKHNLMEELKKMARMTFKVLQKEPDQIFLVLDALTGQNGLVQAQVFKEALPLTGVILTKYDATAKGGIILSIQSQFGLNVKFVGLGEGEDDLKPFDANTFMDKIF